MTTTEKPPDYKVIGTSPLRQDGYEKVTGRAIYGADVKVPSLIHGAILRSPHAHTNIKRIDASMAEALPGVLAVITSADIPEPENKVVDMGEEGAQSAKNNSMKIMSRGKVFYRGHPVAAVAALDANTAIEATKLINVEYEVLRPILDVDEAMAPDAPILHPDLVGMHLGEKVAHTNVARHIRHESGDVEAGFKASSVVLERDYATSTVHQGYIEPHNATAEWHSDGKVTIWVSTQGPWGVRAQCASILRIPESDIRVVSMEIGGGFGGKNPVYLEPIAAVLSRKTGRPVKLIMDRKAVFDATGPSPATKIKVKVGVDDAGTIKAATAQLLYESGAFPGMLVSFGALGIFANYRMEAWRIDGYDIVVNKAKTVPYRAPGATQAGFAMESTIDEVCEALKMDPLEFRIKNATRGGDRKPDGPIFDRIGNLEVVQALKDSAQYQSKLERHAPDGRIRGRGVASAFWHGIGLRSSVNMSIGDDGTVSLRQGSVDIGGSRAAMSMIAAEVLGIRAEDVRPSVVDTESVGYNDGTFGSRTTTATGHATHLCATRARDEMMKRAARFWDIKEEDVEVEAGVFSSKSDPELRLTFKELAAKFRQTGGPVNATGEVMVTHGGDGFSASVVDILVDPDTGKVDVERATMAQDVGTAIHRAYIEGQMQGGVVQAVGWALNEEYFMDDQGVMQNASLLDYRMPTALDLPIIDTIIIEVPNEHHPVGVRGVGETCIIPTVPAIRNALHDALGVRFYSTPMKPSLILEALVEKTGH